MTYNTLSLFSSDKVRAAYSYEEYMVLMRTVVREERTTGPNQSPDYAHYTKLNLARMDRLNKTLELTPDVVKSVKAIQTPLRWYVLTEAWCGDAAQCVPVIAGIAQQNPAISLQLLLRDENPTIMDQYLTNGGRSIPKLIVFDEEGNELFTWGPRPKGAQKIFENFKTTPGRPFTELVEAVQKWYNADKTLSIQSELLDEIKNLDPAKSLFL